MPALRKLRALTRRKDNRYRRLQLQPLEDRRLLAVDSFFQHGVLTIRTDAGEMVTLKSHEGSAQLNLAAPSATKVATEDIRGIVFAPGPDTTLIDVSGINQNAFPSVEQILFADGPWIELEETMDAIEEVLGPGWSTKLLIPSGRAYLVNALWKEPLADGRLAKQLTDAGWSNADVLLNRIVSEAGRRATVRSVNFASASELGFNVLFNGRLLDPVIAKSSDEPFAMPMSGSGDEGDPDPDPGLYLFGGSNNEPLSETGYREIVFQAWLESGNSNPVTFTWDTQAGTATSDVDYTARSSVSVTMPVSQYASSAWLTVEVLGDTDSEPSETFSVAISNLTNASSAVTSADGTIYDRPSLAHQSFNVAENSSNGTIVGTIQWDDKPFAPDVGNLSYTVESGSGQNYFDLNGTTGQITVSDQDVLDFETLPNSYVLNVKVAPENELEFSVTASITVNVTNIYEPPSTPLLDPASDSGIPNDNWTNADYPVFVGSAEIGDTLEIFAGSVLVGSQVVADGTYAIAPNVVLTDGPHVIQARATAAGGGVTYSAGALILVVDRSVPGTPSVPILDPASDSGLAGDNTTRNSTPVFVGAADAGTTVLLFSDGVEVGTGISVGGHYRVVVSMLSDGLHAVEAMAVDPAGNESGLSQALSLTIDTLPTQPPDSPTLDPGSDSGLLDGVTNVTTPVFIGTAVGASSIEILSNGITVGKGPVTSGQYSIQVERLNPGPHGIAAIAFDAAGNPSAASTITDITIKLPPASPSAPVLITADDSGQSSSDSITNVAAPTFTGTAELGATVELFVNGEMLATGVAADGTYAITVPIGNELPHGVHTVTVRAVDEQGSVGPQSPATILTVDLGAVAPSAPVLDPASDSGSSRSDGITYLTSPTFVGSAAPGDTIVLSIDGTVAYVDGLPRDTAVAVDGQYSIAFPGILTDGEHVVAAYAIDVAGNTSTYSENVTITVDSTVPPIPSTPMLDANESKMFHGVAEPNATVTLHSAGVEVGSGTASESGEYSIFAGELGIGTHLVTATASYPLTGASSEASAAASVSIDAPMFELSDNGGAISSQSTIDMGTTAAGKPVTHTFIVTNSGNVDLVLYAPVLPEGFSIAEQFGADVLPGGQATTFTVQLDASDVGQFGGTVVVGSNDSTTSPFAFKIQGEVTAAWVMDNGDPGFSLSPTGWLPDAEVDSAAYLGSYRLSEDDGSEYAEWRFDGIADGTYRVYGNWVGRQDGAQAVYYDIFDYNVANGIDNINVVQTVADHRQDSTGFTDGGVQWQELANTIQVVGGELYVVVYGDLGKTVADGVRIERVINHAPEFDPVPNQNARVDTSLTLSVHASDPDGDEVTYSLGVGAPEGAQVDNDGNFSWTPDASQLGSTVIVEIIATETSSSALSSSTTFAVTVNSGNLLPVFITTGDQTVNATHQLVLQLLAHDPDGSEANLQFYKVDGPTGLTIALDGTVSWTPTIEQSGAEYSVTARVEDAEGGSVLYSFDVAVGSDEATANLPTVTEIELVNDTDTPGDNVTTDRRIRGRVVNSGNSVATVPVQFDSDGNGIADGSVHTDFDGNFEVDLTNTLISDGPATIKFRASVATPTGVVFGSWASATFTFETDPIVATSATKLRLARPSDVGGAHFAHGSLEPSITTPTEGSVATFAGNVSYGAMFGNFLNRFSGLGVTDDVLTLGSSTTVEPSSGPGVPDVTTTESTTDRVISTVAPDGSWTVDEAFYYTYLITSVLDGVSTVVQGGYHAFAFYAFGNGVGATYALTETSNDWVQLQRSTTEGSTVDGVVYSSDQFVTTFESQGFMLTASGSATISGGQVATSDEYFVGTASGSGLFHLHQTDDATHAEWQQNDTINEDSSRQWSYSYNRQSGFNAGGSTAIETFVYSMDDDVLDQSAKSKYTESKSQVVGDVSTQTTATRKEGLTGTASLHYGLSGTRSTFVDSTWTATVDDDFNENIEYGTSADRVYDSATDDDTPNFETDATTSFTSSSSRDETVDRVFGGETVILADTSATYSGTFSSNTTSGYSWQGKETNSYKGTYTTALQGVGDFDSNSISTNSANGSVEFDITDGIVQIDASGVRAEAFESTYSEASHSESTWDDTDKSSWSEDDTTVPYTTTTVASVHSANDAGTSSYDTSALENYGEALDGSSTSSGYYNIFYSGSGNASTTQDESVTTTTDESIPDVVDKSDATFDSYSSTSYGYDTSGHRKVQHSVLGTTVTENDVLNESGTRQSWTAETFVSDYDNTLEPLYRKTTAETVSSSSSRQSTFTNFIINNKVTQTDGTWTSFGGSTYLENGAVTSSLLATSLLKVKDDRDPDHIRHTSEDLASVDNWDGTFSVTDTASANRSTQGVATSNSSFVDEDSGTTTSWRATALDVFTSDKGTEGITNTSKLQVAAIQQGSGTYRDKHTEGTNTDSSGTFTSTSGDLHETHMTGTSDLSRSTKTTSKGTVTSGDVTETIDRTTKSLEKRTGTTTFDDVRDSSTNALGEFGETHTLDTSDTGTVHTHVTLDSDSTRAEPNKNTTEGINSDETLDGTFTDTRALTENQFADGTRDSSDLITNQSGGTTLFSNSVSSTSTEGKSTETVTTNGNIQHTSTVDTTASTVIMLSEDGNGTFSDLTNETTTVDVDGVFSSSKETVQERTQQGTSDNFVSTSNSYHQTDDHVDTSTTNSVFTDDLFTSSRSSKRIVANFDRTDNEESDWIGGYKVSFAKLSEESLNGTFKHTENTSMNSTSHDERVEGIVSDVVVNQTGSFAIPNGSYSHKSFDQSGWSLGDGAYSSSGTETTTSGTSASKSVFSSSDTGVDTVEDGVTTNTSTVAAGTIDGTGKVDTFDKTTTILGATQETHQRKESSSGTVHRTFNVDNSSNGAPTSVINPTTTYTTNTASSLFKQNTVTDGSYDSTSDQFSRIIGGTTIVSDSTEHWHEDLTISRDEEQKSDTHEVGTHQDGTDFDNKQHYESETDESWSEDIVEDSTETLETGSTFKRTTKVTGGTGTYYSLSTDDRSSTHVSGGVTEKKTKNTLGEDDLATTFSSETEETVDVALDGTVTATHEETSDSGSSPGGAFGHREEYKERTTVTSGVDSGFVYDEVIKESSLTTDVHEFISGAGVDQGTITTTTFNGTGTKSVLHIDGVSTAETEAYPDDVTISTYKRHAKALTETDWALDGSTTQYADAASAGYTNVQATLEEDIVTTNGTEHLLVVDRALSSGGTVWNRQINDSTWGNKTGSDKHVTTTSSLDPNTGEIVKTPVTVTDIAISEEYGLTDTTANIDLSSGAYHDLRNDTAHTERRFGSRGDVDYKILIENSTSNLTTTEISTGNTRISNSESKFKRELTDDQAANIQLLTEVTTSNYDTTDNIVPIPTDSSGNDSRNFSLQQTHSGTSVTQTRDESYNSTSSGPTDGEFSDHSFTEHLVITRPDFGAPVSVDAYTYTGNANSASRTPGWPLYLSTTTENGQPGSESGSYEVDWTVIEGYEGQTQTTTQGTTTTYPGIASFDFDPAFWGGGPGTPGSIPTFDEALLALAQGVPPGSDSFFQAISSFISSAIPTQVTKLVGDPLAFVIAITSPIGAVNAATQQVGTGIVNSALDFVTTDFTNLKAAGKNNLLATIITIGDGLGHLAGLESLTNAVEGKNREGEHLSGLARAGYGALGTYEFVSTVIPIARGTQVGLFAAGSRLGFGRAAGGAIQQELIEASLTRGVKNPIACFLAGTLVATEDGQIPIEQVTAGQRVWSCDLTTGQWRLCRVAETFVLDAVGELAEVFVAGRKIESTFHHPFWVVRGEDLDRRPTPDHVASAMVPGATVPGRWVDAGDLRVGDELLLMDGRRERVENLVVRHLGELVYNFRVDHPHNYAVGPDGVLVHNNPCGQSTIGRIIEGTKGLGHSYGSHSGQWFNRHGGKPSLAKWTELIKEATKSNKILPWSSRGTPTIAHFARIGGNKPFLVQFYANGPRAGELLTAFIPNKNQLRAIYEVFAP